MKIRLNPVLASPAIVLAALAGVAPAAPDDGSRARIAMIDIEGAPTERPSELAWLFGPGKEHTLHDYLTALKRVADDDSYAGLVLRLKDAELGAAQVEELGAALTEVRRADKKVHVFADAYGTTELMLGAYADEVIAQDGAPVSMPGLYMEEMFLADTLAWAGVKADMVQVGDYKGASEQMARNGPSKEWDQNINQLLDSMYANIRSPIMSGRKLTGDQLDSAMKVAWMTEAKDAKDLHLIDTVLDLTALSDHLKDEYHKEVSWDTGVLVPEDDETSQIDAANPFGILAKLGQEPDWSPSKDTIAVVHITGPIIDGESTSGGGPLSSGESTGCRTIRNALEDIRKNDLFKGVVVRIDSPGGSATASEIIWQGVRRTAEKKPVWVSVGGMAASGGYYIAVSGDKIYVNPSSIVGSIGVVGGKMSMSELYKTLKVNVVGRGRGPMADMFASSSTWDEADRAAVRAKMTDTYNLFTSRVTAGRKGIDLSKTAEGRLFTGNRAIEMKMADKVGGLEQCIGDLAKQAGISEDYEVMHFPAPRPFGEVIGDALGNYIQAPRVQGTGPLAQNALGVVREVMGDGAFVQVQDDLRAFMLLRDHRVLLMNPRVMILK
ncbi:MAG: S49 family peptidase [Phycisphaerales bacterium]